jgi:hypothetical protein
MSRRWAVCRVCDRGFDPRSASQDVCCLACLARDPRHLVGWPVRLRQAQRKRERARRAA